MDGKGEMRRRCKRIKIQTEKDGKQRQNTRVGRAKKKGQEEEQDPEQFDEVGGGWEREED